MTMITNEQLDRLFAAFNAHDGDAVMRYFADDVVFDTVAGDQAHGTRIEGREAVKAAFENTWGTMPDVQWINGRHYFVEGASGFVEGASEQQMIVSESTFVATQPDGKRVEADGIDLFTVRDGKITRKQAFRKQRPPFIPR
ncbi:MULTISPECIES: nuclear transport factor 2 family protein [Halomonas]|uniref:nuclear transport factor 2 family protein n=1 Tax=Halomonas TaxID=2745 RepID=UPI001C95753F|nr:MULTISPECIES: nuclear transport factor 2 family protein [Halomonas]MBY6208997.1 nuclear transport factor 2 family protein [Halomonas sp. DP3Y7-2]MBY6227467.1 nuclear transport factor 2 family protein [Halomonas sp. DP3Y7-1]MCA0914782.1 nuclear transport factor 2 family protein [Halomonas denitrificans]